MIREFAQFRLDTDRAEVSGPDGPVPLEPKALALLRLLAERACGLDPLEPKANFALGRLGMVTGPPKDGLR